MKDARGQIRSEHQLDSTTKKPDKGIRVWCYPVKNQRDKTVRVFDYKWMFQMRV